MLRREKSFFIIAFILLAASAQAKTASEVFESVSASVVVVKTYDDKGGDKMLGSGVIFKTGVVVTNCHVLKEAATVQVVYQEAKYPATLLHSDWDRDICSLTVDGLKAPVVAMGSTSRLKVGEKVYAVGAPQGLELTLSDGLISSLRQVEGGQYLQITAPISPGSSGGGLFDDKGQLIGLPTFYLTDGQQLNFAVPVEWVNELPKRNAPAPQAETTTSTEWINKAVAFEEKKDWAGLLKHTLSWTKTHPENVDAWYSLGVAYGKLDQLPKEIEAYQQAILINSEDAGAWASLAFAYARSNQMDKALEACQQAIRLKPAYAELWVKLGSAYWLANQTPEAIEAYQQSIRLYPENAVAWYSLGILYDNQNQTVKAIEAYQQAIRVNPDFEDAWGLLGVYYGKSNQIAKSIEAFQQVVRINPENVMGGWYGLGLAYKLSGQTSQVMEVYKRLKTIDPARADQFFNKIVLP